MRNWREWFSAGVEALVSATLLCGVTTPAHAWGDEGHEVGGLIAKHYLDAAVLKKVNTILAGDNSHLTPHRNRDAEATWADKFGTRTETPLRFITTRLATGITWTWKSQLPTRGVPVLVSRP
jgi:hypothetical protein